MDNLVLFLIVVLTMGLGIYLGRRFGRMRAGQGRDTAVYSSIEQLKSVGLLSVYKVFTKEIVTEIDHSWGQIGKEYLSWFLTNKKMAMIFNFEIDFRYDLKSDDFKILKGEGEGSYTLQMPPCRHDIKIRDIRFYDEQKARLLPFLIPDILNSVFGPGFSEEDKNRLMDAARQTAEAQATSLIGSLGADVQRSAVQTLQSLARAFGASKVEFAFVPGDPGKPVPGGKSE